MVFVYQSGTHITIIGSSLHDLTEDIIHNTYSPASRVVAAEGLTSLVIELPILLAEPSTLFVGEPVGNIEMINILSRLIYCRRTGHFYCYLYS